MTANLVMQSETASLTKGKIFHFVRSIREQNPLISQFFSTS